MGAQSSHGAIDWFMHYVRNSSSKNELEVQPMLGKLYTIHGTPVVRSVQTCTQCPYAAYHSSECEAAAIVFRLHLVLRRRQPTSCSQRKAEPPALIKNCEVTMPMGYEGLAEAKRDPPRRPLLG
eukprot:6188067-Pleurochrysis_carterae.AAC.2